MREREDERVEMEKKEKWKKIHKEWLRKTGKGVRKEKRMKKLMQE